MNQKLNLIMNILIILLIVALVFVMMNYYAGTPTGSGIPTNIDVIKENIIPDGNESIISNNITIKETSGETIINVNSSGEIVNASGENSGDVAIIEPPKDETTKQENPTVIMTSENEISSKEKKEILTELDKTLMELLDVVDKVQTVDETRLIIDDSEVQE